MPSHPDRVAKNYASLCVRCLTYVNRDWDNETLFPNLCDGCSWLTHYINGDIYLLNNSNILRILKNYPASYKAFGIEIPKK